MDMEADLGIDSIKKVEILVALQSRIPELADADTASHMATLTTPRGILAFAEQLTAERRQAQQKN